MPVESRTARRRLLDIELRNPECRNKHPCKIAPARKKDCYGRRWNGAKE
jgi:hypothetical protein